ncbi:MAG: NADH-quinone oxidoreductase subunit NuoH [Ignavibacteria bacterium]
MVILIPLAKIAIAISILLFVVTYLVYFERKISAWIQDRIGPNRVGPYGLLQSPADVLKLFFKEDIVPLAATKFVHSLAPVISLTIAMSTYAVIPFGPDINLFGQKVKLIVADVDIGVLFILAFTSIGVYGITLSGWGSNNKYSLLGGLRSSAQMISYELSMGISVVGVLMVTGSLRIYDIINHQQGWMWNAFIQPIGFITFVVAAFAETNRLPFDLPEAEPELVGGYHTEYSSLKFAMFFLAEYANMIVASLLIAALYLGGWHLPFVDTSSLSEGWLPLISIGIYLAKVCFLLFFFIWVRWSIPRFRYDQLMNLGWKVMLPLSLVNLVWVAILVYFFKI